VVVKVSRVDKRSQDSNPTNDSKATVSVLYWYFFYPHNNLELIALDLFEPWDVRMHIPSYLREQTSAPRNIFASARAAQ